MFGKEKIKIIQLQCDFGARPEAPGAALGGNALLKYDDAHDKIFSNFPVAACGENKRSEREFITTRQVDKIYSQLQTGVSLIENALSENYFPFIISGDHSNAMASVSAIHNFFPEKTIGVIWIDAHADMHTPLTTPSGNMHGMPLAALMATDNNRYQRNVPNDDELQYWNKLKELGSRKIVPKISPRDVLLIG